MKLALDVPAAIVTEVIVAVSAVLRKTPPAEVLVRVTVTAEVAFTGEPEEVCSCTVIVPEVTPAVSVWALVVNPSLEATVATVRVAVSVWPLFVAVTVWAPAVVAVQLAFPLLHEPFGVMANVVPDRVRGLLNTSKPETVYVCEPPDAIVEVLGAIAM